jgi:hypothetical protein
MCDFTSVKADLKAKETKLHTLRELDNLFADLTNARNWPEKVGAGFWKMIEANLFRPVQTPLREHFVAVELPVMIEPAWPHLQPTYLLLIKYQMANPTDSRLNLSFCRRLLHNLLAPDQNEHELILFFIEQYLLMHSRDERAIVKQISHFLHLYVDGAIRPSSVLPILKFTYAQWKDTTLFDSMFTECIVPLVWSPHFVSFRSALEVVCEVALVLKAVEWANLLARISRHIPVTMPSKLPAYIDFLIFVIGHVEPQLFAPLAPRIFKTIASLATSPHVKVAEQSLKCWNEVAIIGYLFAHPKTIFPIICPAIRLASRTHWCPSTQRLASDVAKSLRRIDAHAYEEAIEPTKTTKTDVPHCLWVRGWSVVAKQAFRHHCGISLDDTLQNIRKSFTQFNAESEGNQPPATAPGIRKRVMVNLRPQSGVVRATSQKSVPAAAAANDKKNSVRTAPDRNGSREMAHSARVGSGPKQPTPHQAHSDWPVRAKKAP